jgi:hypothetical protein
VFGCHATCVDGARLSGARRLHVQTGQSRAKRKWQARTIVKIEFCEIAGCNHGRALTIAMAKRGLTASIGSLPRSNIFTIQPAAAAARSSDSLRIILGIGIGQDNFRQIVESSVRRQSQMVSFHAGRPRHAFAGTACLSSGHRCWRFASYLFTGQSDACRCRYLAMLQSFLGPCTATVWLRIQSLEP